MDGLLLTDGAARWSPSCCSPRATRSSSRPSSRWSPSTGRRSTSGPPRATGAPGRCARRCASCRSSSPAPSSASPSPRCSPATWPSRRWPSSSRRCSSRSPATPPSAITHVLALVARHAALDALRRAGAEERRAGPADARRRWPPPARCAPSPGVFGWLIRALNGSANWLVRRLGVEPQEELASARSPEELGLLAAISAQAGALPDGDRDAAAPHDPVRREAGGRGDDPAGRRGRRCRPRASVAELLDAVAARPGTSRFPVYEETLDQVIGVVAVIDALGVPPAARAATPVPAVAREPVLRAGDPRPRRGAGRAAGGRRRPGDRGRRVRRHRRRGHHRGPGRGAGRRDRRRARPGRAWTTTGVDRADRARRRARPGWSTACCARTSWPSRPASGCPRGRTRRWPASCMARLGHIPVAGETVDEDGWEFTVVEVDRHRIEQVRVVAPGGAGRR